MGHINKIELQGRVGNIRINTVNGTTVANFSLVTEFLYKNKEGIAASETTWHTIAAWAGKDMPDLTRLQKGIPVNVTGRIRTTKYTTSDGLEKQYPEVLANKVRFLTEEELEA